MEMKNMKNRKSGENGSFKSLSTRVDTYRTLYHKLLYKASKGIPIFTFVSEVLKLILDFFKCDAIELVLKEAGRRFICTIDRDKASEFDCEVLSKYGDNEPSYMKKIWIIVELEKLTTAIESGNMEASLPIYTKIINLQRRNTKTVKAKQLYDNGGYPFDGEFKSILVLAFAVDLDNIGLIQFKSKKANFFKEREIKHYENVAETLGITFAYRRTNTALRERLKELTCLYEITRALSKQNMTLETIFTTTMDILLPAMLYPDVASGRIIIDGQEFVTPHFNDTSHRISSNILVHEQIRGLIEIGYSKNKPRIDIGPFMIEEKDLLDAIAREIARILDRRQTEIDRHILREQLRHADRLATIGQLAAGVAHEINEPLGSILGFAQLIEKNPELPDQINKDITKIINASLLAREVVKKLVLFVKQVPPNKIHVNINQVIRDGLYLLENRLIRYNIDVDQKLDDSLPEIVADPLQLSQVLINLVVNAVHAMPDGGRLKITTRNDDGMVCFAVEDTGTGMTEEVKSRIFEPFFTTKDINVGTGLGLPVAQGIISAHGGTIAVTTKVGKGSKFEVKIPIKSNND